MSEREPEHFEFGSSHPPDVPGSGGSRRSLWVIAAGVLLVVTGAGGLLYYDRELAAKLLKDTPFAPAAQVTTVYKWRNDQGDWQIADQPPPGGIAYEVLEYNSDTNVMPLVPREED